MGRKRRNSRRSKNRAKARSRAKASAKKRNAARKASGRKPSGANKAANRAKARARAQAAAKKRVAAKKAAAKKSASKKKTARTAAAKRAAAKAAAKKRAQDAAKKRIAAKKASEAKKKAATKKAATTKKATTTRKATAKTTRESAFNKQLKKVQAANIGPVRDGATYARNLTNYNMKYGKTPAIRAKAYEQSLNKKSFKGLSDGQTFGVGPVASGDAYARGLNTDNQNVENRLRQVRNLGSTLTGGVISPVRKLTDKEISDRRMKVAARRQANFMGRETGGKGNKGASPFGTLASVLSTALDVLPEPAGSGVSNKQEGMDEDNLTRIQNQAYSTALSNNMAGLGGDFDFGPRGSQMSISDAPGLQAGQSRGRRRIRRFGRGRRRGAADSFRRGGRRIQEFTSNQLNI